MGFKFRLETSLHLANQELDIARGLLAGEVRKLQMAREQRDYQDRLFLRAQQGQKRACLQEPSILGVWQKYSLEQKMALLQREEEVEKQEKIVAEYREKLIECRIKVEKYKRLREKKLRLFYKEELKKEQAVLDEIAQEVGHDFRNETE